MEIKICPICKKRFKRIYKNQKYCSKKCSLIAGKKYQKQYNSQYSYKTNCVDCGKEIWKPFKRCKHCAKVYQYKTNPNSNPMKGKTGELHPTFIHGKSHHNNICLDCGKKIWFGFKRCKSCARIEQYKDPRNHPNYVDGKSKEPYTMEFKDSLKESIRKRDNYECQNCSMTEEEHLIVNGQVLHVHHIDYNKENCKESNLISLCGCCNSRANFNRSYWKEFYTTKVLI